MKKRNVTNADYLIVAGFALIAAVYQWYRWRGIVPYVFLNSDAANIAGFAAAWEHPELFRGDELLSDPGNFRFYAAAHIPLLRLLSHVFGDFGTAFMSLLGVTMLLQSAGFYTLGRVVLKNRFWAVLLALITLRRMPVSIGAESWGVFVDAIPRSIFQALLPFLLAAAYHWRGKPRVWPWLMACAGLMMYLHPPSGPCIAFALWLGFIFFMPREWPALKRIGFALLLGAIFIASVAPFLAVYLSGHVSGRVPNYDEIFKIMNERFNDNYFAPTYLLKKFSRRMLSSLLLPAAVAGAALALRFRRDDRKSIHLFFVWAAGILFVSYAIPFTELTYANANHMLPTQLDLIRGLRYLYPLAFLLSFIGLAGLHKRAKTAAASKTIVVVGLLTVAAWTLIHQPPWRAVSFRDMLMLPRFETLYPGNREMVEAMIAVKEMTPPGALIMPSMASNPLAVRYYAMRPVAFSLKDGGALAYANTEKLLKWYPQWKRLLALEAIEDPDAKLKGYIAMAEDLHADYLIIDLDANRAGGAPKNTSLIFDNGSFSLIKLNQDGVKLSK